VTGGDQNVGFPNALSVHAAVKLVRFTPYVNQNYLFKTVQRISAYQPYSAISSHF